MAIEIPERLQSKLSPSASKVILPDVLNSECCISTYLETTPCYFQEYTMHGTRHINRVLEYADKLIPQSEFDKLSELDVTVLVLGICLHDLGMYIKQDGLEYLLGLDEKFIVGENSEKQVSWQELWDDFIVKIKRFSGKESEDIFGTKDNKCYEFNIDNPKVCLVFVRWYHHQIAYYIAVHGFPGKEQNDLLKGISEDERKLIGLLAKSHGMSLRGLEKEIDDFGYDNNFPLNVPIYYLMSILRLADLLDADGQRAPKILSDMNEFSSRRSKNEWTLNQLITGRQWAEQTRKPETFRIIAKPTTSIQYIELKSWFSYWQKELDESWAVLGEKHGSKYKLSVRRITSNIFDSKSKYDFVTNPITLKVNPDIVKLLVSPLYGDDPSYGLRELIQNAVDACNERTAIDGKADDREIIVDIDKDRGTFIISDNGIGMNEDVIANYYLTAGASYRYSSQWADNFVDDNSNPKVVRSGRFGVGALATFLIGNKAKITTRHINDKKGYCFEYTIEPELLNVTKTDKAEPGTTIEITVNKKSIEKFADWDSFGYLSHWNHWYHFTYPKITYRINGKVKKQKGIFNIEKGKDSDGWFYCKSKKYDSFHWSVKNHIWGGFMCNGIYIPDGMSKQNNNPLKNSIESKGYFGILPNISVIDKKGILPLDLARKFVLDDFISDIDDSFWEEICKYRIAEILTGGEQKNYLFSQRGYIPTESSFIQNLNTSVYFIRKSDSVNILPSDFEDCDFGVAFFVSGASRLSNNLDKIFVDNDHFRYEHHSRLEEMWVNKKEIIIPETVYYLPEDKIHSIDSSVWYKDLPVPSSLLEDVSMVVRYEPTPVEKDNVMYKMIQKYLPRSINGGWIPFDEKEREELYKDTYKELERYINPLKEEKTAKHRGIQN